MQGAMEKEERDTHLLLPNRPWLVVLNSSGVSLGMYAFWPTSDLTIALKNTPRRLTGLLESRFLEKDSEWWQKQIPSYVRICQRQRNLVCTRNSLSTSAPPAHACSVAVHILLHGFSACDDFPLITVIWLETYSVQVCRLKNGNTEKVWKRIYCPECSGKAFLFLFFT